MDTELDEKKLEAQGEPNYYKEAFFNQYNLIFLGGMLGLSLLYPPLLYLTLGLESIYMALLPDNPRFRRLVRSWRLEQMREERNDRLRERFAALGDLHKKRFLALKRVCESIESMASGVSRGTMLLLEQDLEKLEYLLESFLDMLLAVQRIDQYLRRYGREAIEDEIARLKADLKEVESERVRRVKERNIEILRKRLARYDALLEQKELLKANLDTIEDTLSLLEDNVLSMQDRAGVVEQIDGMIGSIEENQHLIEELEGEISSVSEPPATDEREVAAGEKDDESEKAGERERAR